ncbi:hypothetical protein M2222_008321 [Bradyrhizobium elkanii]|uniref:hypothetical protein n=1 Tax=Bradyrhizobium elkanii TaxID=29448 RepID=UPI0021680A47|nr:hypothetical protein [Bradyrhizobium elkanii]MCS3451902.1 hypothetical protein [Bradyrhizobium elkanii]MCS3565999.1 hypothetical protein [Bradyrhizobium elkanii]MCW2153271.1 hypothetical protein [Bradyrhizobium elkanii]MCW2377004.1 hypothetical protein [Bradyrhizobium elkanii]
MTNPRNAAETRHCRRCEKAKPLREFHKMRKGLRQTMCKPCLTAINNGDVFTMNSSEAAKFMERMEAGEALRTLMGGYPGSICGRKAFFKHCELNPEWGARAMELAKVNRRARILDGVVKLRTSRTACGNGHPLTAEVTQRMREERRWDARWCEPCMQKWHGVGRYIAEDATEEPPVPAGFLKLAGPPCIVPADVTLIEEWLRKGVSIKKLFRPSDMVRFRKFRRANPEWEAKWKPIIDANGVRVVATAARKLWKSRNITHCKRGHELTPENSYVKAAGTRQCKICQNDLKIKIGAPVTDKAIDIAERALLSGMNFKQITTPMDGRRSILSPYQFRTLRLTRPDVVRRLGLAVRNPVTISRITAGMTIVPMPVQSIELGKQPMKEFKSADIPLYFPEPGDFEWFYSLTPRWLSPDDRKDVVSNIYIALANREVRKEDVPKNIKKYVTQHTNLHPYKAYGGINSALPMDEPIFLDGKKTLAEELHIGLWSEESIYA